MKENEIKIREKFILFTILDIFVLSPNQTMGEKIVFGRRRTKGIRERRRAYALRGALTNPTPHPTINLFGWGEKPN